MKATIHSLLVLSAIVASAITASAQVPSASYPFISTDYQEARNVLVKTMTGVDPLTQKTITDPPYGATGWMQVGADDMLRFNGLNQNKPIIIYDEATDSSHDLNDLDVHDLRISEASYVLTVQQRRDFGRCIEPVCIHLITSLPYSGEPNLLHAYINVRSMRANPESDNICCNYSALIPDIYSSDFLIHHTRSQDDMINGNWSNNLKRNEALSAFASASACDLNADGYDDIIIFLLNNVFVIDGKDYDFKKGLDLSSYCATFPTDFSSKSLSYGYKTEKSGFNPHTWTSTTGDFDGDGIQDVLAICHTGLYWDHCLDAVSGMKTYDPYPGKVFSVFIPGGRFADLKNISGLVCKSMGETPQLPFVNHWFKGEEYKYGPRWGDTNVNTDDGVLFNDFYHYYHVTLSADVVYPKGEYNSDQPVLVIGWKYMWSYNPTESDVDKFRYGLTEWYQLTSYNMRDNLAAFTSPEGGTPVEAARADMYDLLSSTPGWNDENHTPRLQYGWYYYTTNARASLGAPALKTWYANGRAMSPFLYFAGMSLYYRPDASQKFEVASLDPLGQEIGWVPATPKVAKEDSKRGRICGRPYTVLDYMEADGEGGQALTDHETLIVPAASHQREIVDDARYYFRYRDQEYSLLRSRFSSYDPATGYVAITTQKTDEISVLTNSYNSIFQPVPYTRHMAKVRLTDSYYNASNPVVKAVLAIPPYNTDDVVDATYAQVAFSKSQDYTTEQSKTSSSTVGGGFSMGTKLFNCLKLSYSKSYETEWSQSWAQDYTISRGIEYSSGKQEDMVLFSYIPVDCFEYEIEAAPCDDDLVGQTFVFRRALNLLYGNESHIPEMWWTVNDYNTHVARAGLPRIDRRIFSHTVGVVDSYRRVPRFCSASDVIKYFPRKADGFYAVHDESTAGTGFITQSLGIAQGAGHTEGSSESVTTQLSFDIEIDDCPFSGNVDHSFGKSEGWELSTSWAEGITVSGTTPTLIDAANNYTFRQVWYEYADAESGQDFLVVDWAVATNDRRSDYAKLEFLQMYDGTDGDGTAYYCPQLEWNVVSSDPVECVLEYRIDPVTPDRLYDDLTGSVELGETSGWTAILKEPDAENDTWATLDFSATTTDGLNHSWRFIDFFSLTPEQQARLQALANGSDVNIHYRVKVYRRDTPAAAQSAPARVAEANLLATTNEVSYKLITGTTSTGVADLTADPATPVEIYDLRGIRIADPATLAPGLYLRRQGPTTSKILIR